MAYIDKAKAIEKLTAYKENHLSFPKSCLGMIDTCITLIKIIPTADVAEVKRGEWQKETDDFDWEYIKCSVCGEELYPPDNDDTFDILPKYCQTCGAKMDGGKKE